MRVKRSVKVQPDPLANNHLTEAIPEPLEGLQRAANSLVSRFYRHGKGLVPTERTRERNEEGRGKTKRGFWLPIPRAPVGRGARFTSTILDFLEVEEGISIRFGYFLSTFHFSSFAFFPSLPPVSPFSFLGRW